MFKLLIFSLLLLHFCNSMNLKWFRYDETKSENEGDLEVEWKKFKSRHNKLYGREEELRKSIFADNFKFIKEHNDLHQKGLKSFTLAINEYADLTLREFKGMMNGLKEAKRANDSTTYLSSEVPIYLPTAVDWRKKPGMVSEVKNQGRCGSCWAFSTTGSLEGQHFRKTGEKVDLSEQNLVDCSSDYDNNGCNGGLMTNAFKYIKANKGIDTEKVYPYVGKEQDCLFKKHGVGATVTGFIQVKAGDEDSLKEAVATVGPVSVAIDAGHHSFMFYNSGIYDEPDCSSTELDHGVLAVGYGSEDGEDYWIVKNSWGEMWGEKGYVRMSRNHNDQCGIASMASYPLV